MGAYTPRLRGAGSGQYPEDVAKKSDPRGPWAYASNTLSPTSSGNANGTASPIRGACDHALPSKARTRMQAGCSGADLSPARGRGTGLLSELEGFSGA